MLEVGAAAGRGALAALSPTEKGDLLEALLAANPSWQPIVEAAAADRLAHVNRDRVAVELREALCGLGHELIGERAGYHPGHGYVEPTQAAVDILSEELESYLQDVARRDQLGLTGAAAELGAGVLLGLYSCRDYQAEETVLAWVEDFPDEQARWLAERMHKTGLLPPTLAEQLANLMPQWAPWILARSEHQ
jgi:hypothetical protein